MPTIQYEDINFSPATLETIRQANAIIREYEQQGYDLTLRQLYYQFVARDFIPNAAREYNRLGNVVSKARRAGMIDWDAIVDRTRNLETVATWGHPKLLVDACADQFRYDPWLEQEQYVEVWFEKDALMGVFERPAERWCIPSFSCRGYPSDSEVWRAAQRLARVQSGNELLFRGCRNIEAHPREVTILHFGDHDPSGIDMTRDIRDRLRLFGAAVTIRRLALNRDQIARYKPPPNPAKETDARFADYARKYGRKSWELDSLDPPVLVALVEEAVRAYVDMPLWHVTRDREESAREALRQAAKWVGKRAL